MLARTLRPHTAAPQPHVDCNRDSDAFPMLGFIIMVDDFRPDNGAARFIAGSHLWQTSPKGDLSDIRADDGSQLLACGKAGPAVIFNGSVWHGHTANVDEVARRSIQGYFVPRKTRPEVSIAVRLAPEALARLTPLEKYLLAVT